MFIKVRQIIILTLSVSSLDAYINAYNHPILLCLNPLVVIFQLKEQLTKSDRSPFVACLICIV